MLPFPLLDSLISAATASTPVVCRFSLSSNSLTNGRTYATRGRGESVGIREALLAYAAP